MTRSDAAAIPRYRSLTRLLAAIIGLLTLTVAVVGCGVGGGDASSRDDAFSAGFSMTDNDLVAALASEGITGTSGQDQHTSGRGSGLYDSWQIRRGSLIGLYLNTVTDDEIQMIAEFIRNSQNHEFETPAEARTGFNNMRTFFNDPTRLFNDSEWEKFTQPGSGRTFSFRDFMNLINSNSALSGPRSRWNTFFDDVPDPFVFTRISTDPYNDLLNQLEATAALLSDQANTVPATVTITGTFTALSVPGCVFVGFGRVGPEDVEVRVRDGSGALIGVGGFTDGGRQTDTRGDCTWSYEVPFVPSDEPVYNFSSNLIAEDPGFNLRLDELKASRWVVNIVN